MSEPEVFYCRLCANLKSTPDVVFIKKDGGIKRKIYEKVVECFHLENSFPSSVCPDCWVQATSMYDLYKKVLRAQEILRSIDQASFQVKPDNVEDSTIKVEIDEATLDSVKLKHENGVEFGNENDSDWDNKQDDWSDCKDDIEIEDREDDDWNQPLSVIIKEAVVKDEKPNEKKKKVNKTKKGVKKQKKERDEWKDYIFYCTLCTADFTKVTELRKHFESKHDNKPTEYKCMDCVKISTRYPLFRRHVRKHRAKYKFQCKQCKKSFQISSNFERHMELVHGPDEIQKSLCPICGKSFKSSTYLEKHKRFVHLPDDEKYQFECEICHKKLSSIQTLKSHKKVHEDTWEHTCEHCGDAFKYQASLNAHITHKHTEVKDSEMLKCLDCPKTFRHALALKRHQKIHMDTELFHCEVCARPFKHKRALNRHASIHTNLLPFECEYCGKCFRTQSFLKIHLRQHTGEKPYSCIECNQHFTNDSNFIKHIRGKHGLKQFSIANQKQYPFVNQ